MRKNFCSSAEDLRPELSHRTCTVTERFHIHARTIEQGKPHVTEWCLRIGHHDVLAKFDPSTSTGEDGGAVIEVMLAADIGPESHADMIE